MSSQKQSQKGAQQPAASKGPTQKYPSMLLVNE